MVASGGPPTVIWQIAVHKPAHSTLRMLLLQALAKATSSGKGGAIAQVLAEAFASGGTASASADAIAIAYGKNKRGVSEALASALATASSDGRKTGAAASAVAEVRVPRLSHTIFHSADVIHSTTVVCWCTTWHWLDRQGLHLLCFSSNG